MNTLTHNEIATAKAAQPDHSCDWFFDALTDFLSEFERRLADKPTPNGELCGDCTLTPYFFFSRRATYKTAIWLKVNRNANPLDIPVLPPSPQVWFRVGFSPNIQGNKNVNMWSDCELKCPGIIMRLRQFALPPNFAPLGIFKTLNHVVPMDNFDPIFTQICAWMLCACTAGCKKP